MKKLIMILLLVIIFYYPLYGSTKTNSLIILEEKSGIDFTDSAIELVNKYAGEVYHVFRSKVLMGYLPPDNVAHLIGRAGILDIYQTQTQPDKADPIVNAAIKAFNNLLQPVKELTEEELEEREAEGFKDKVRKTYPAKDSKTNISDRFTSEYMIGRVAVGIVIVEGNGPPQYNWTSQGLDSATNQIIYGLDWLANRASESNSNVCWFYDWHYSVPVPEEPILGPSGIDLNDDDGVISWIGYAIQALGYNPGSCVWDPFVGWWVFTDGVSAIYTYVHNIRRSNKTDWGFAMFVANGNLFADGNCAWVMWWNDWHLLGLPIPLGRWHGGPYFVMTRENDWYYFSGMYEVVAHETFHIFGPADEYHKENGTCENSGSCDDEYGYLQIENRNCEHCDGSIDCIMKDGVTWDGACVYTRYQAGWRDLDGDGPADPIDPNSHRYCWIGPPQANGPVQIGDIIKTWTLDGDFVKSIAITPDNCGLRTDGYCDVMWDGTNAWGATCAPGTYRLTINDGSPKNIPLLTVDPSTLPIFCNFQFENGVLYWRLNDCWAYVRLKIYNSSNQLVLYPIKDKVHFPNSYYGNEHHQTDLYGLIEGVTYTAEFFGWCPAGNRSDTTEYSFVYHCDLNTPTIASVGAIDTCIYFEWDDNNRCELGYIIERKDMTSGQWIVIDTTILDVESYTDPQIMGSETYYYRIKAYNSFGASDYSNTVSKKAHPHPPTILYVENWYCNRPVRPAKVTPSEGGILTFKSPDTFDCYPPYPDSIPSDLSVIYVDYPVNQKPGTYAKMGARTKSCQWYNHNHVSPETLVVNLQYHRILIHTPPDTIYCTGDWTYYFQVRTHDIYGDTSMWLPQPWGWPYACCVGPCHIPIEPTEDMFKIEIPIAFSLEQNHPNPFNPETQIRYALPQASPVKLVLYNILGQKVRILVDEYQTAGYKTVHWDGRNESGNELASGIYFYRLRAGKYNEVKRMTLVK